MYGKKDSYADIINLPRPISSKHPPMSRENRAAQFSPFAALVGFEDAVDETARFTQSRIELDEQALSLLDEKLHRLLEHIAEKPEVNITYFVPDLLKNGGEYRSHRGRLCRIDRNTASISFSDGLSLYISDIYEIDSIIL